MTDQQPALEPVVGRFSTPEAARAAMVRLEGAGFDGVDIDLQGTDPAVARTDVANEHDMEATGDVARGATLGATIGGAAGVAAGIVTAAVTGDPTTGVVVGTTGAIGAGTIGGLAGTYVGLPASSQAFETYEIDPNDPEPITVTVRVRSADEAERARAALEG